MALRDALNRGDPATAQKVYDRLLRRSEQNAETGLGDHYTVTYLKRFVGRSVEAATAATAEPHRVVKVLDDRWQLAYDPLDEGLKRGFHEPGFDDAKWTSVATYSDTLDAQGLPDRQTILWYRTAFELPDPCRAPALFFVEVDGDAAVYLNGQHVGSSEKKRQPFEVDLSVAATEGQNVLAVRVDHTQITELFLGGIIRPVLLIEKNAQR